MVTSALVRGRVTSTSYGSTSVLARVTGGGVLGHQQPRRGTRADVARRAGLSRVPVSYALDEVPDR